MTRVPLKIDITITTDDGQVSTMTYCPGVYPGNSGSPAPSELVLLTSSLPTATVGVPYSTQLIAEGGTTPYTWDFATGALPAWATLNASSGVISGTPTSADTINLTPRVTDAAAETATNGSLVLVIEAAPAGLSITTTSLPPGDRGVAYSTTLVASGNTGAVTWSLVAPNNVLPTGLSLTGAVIDGTPTAASSPTVTVRATDSLTSVDRALTLTVNEVADLQITTETLAAGEETVAYSRTVNSAGGWGAKTWSKILGDYPAGITLDTDTGILSGTPTTEGTYHFTLRVTDSEARTADKPFALVINAEGTVADPNAFFTAAIADPSCNLSYSLRDAGLLVGRNVGGLVHNPDIGVWWTYDPGSDSDPHAQDASKCTIPAFPATGFTVAAPVGASDSSVTVSGIPGWSNGDAIRIDNELMTVIRASGAPPETAFPGGVVPVNRAQLASSAATHSVGAVVGKSTNGLTGGRQLRWTLNTQPGNSYFWVWDDFFTDSYIKATHGLKNYKAYQLTARKSTDTIWFELATRFVPFSTAEVPTWNSAAHVCVHDARHYGGGADPPTLTEPSGTPVYTDDLAGNPKKIAEATRYYPIRPIANATIKHPNRWVRHFIHYQQADATNTEWDVLNYWVADEVNDPVKVYDNLRTKCWHGESTGGPPNDPSTWGIREFWVEHNTSDSAHLRGNYPEGVRDFVIYVRNWFQLTNPADYEQYLVKPIAAPV